MTLQSRDLELVRQIAAAGSMTAAAKRLHVTQSAVSQRLSGLQQRLGVSLFERRDGVLKPTRAGRRLVAGAQVVGDALDAALTDVLELAEQRERELRIATQCYTCYRWLPFVVREMHAEFPQLSVDVVPEATDAPYAALEDDLLDIAIVSNPDPASELEETNLFGDEFFAVMHEDHALAGRKTLAPQQFAGQTLLLYTGRKHAIVEEVLAPAGVQPGRIVQVRITEAIVELARAGQGIAVIAGWAFDDLPDTSGLRKVRIGRYGFRRRWRAVRNERCSEEHAAALVRAIRAVGATLAEESWRTKMQGGLSS